MRTRSGQSCFLGVILFVVGCDANNSVVPGTIGGDFGVVGGSSTASSAKGSGGTSSDGGKTGIGQSTGTGSKVESTTSVGGATGSGGSNEGDGGSIAEATGGRVSAGGTTASQTGGTSMARGGSSAVATGGVGPITGGSTGRGGTQVTGGASPTSGGNTARTIATGGIATGGNATGGIATGGNATGGSPPTGGAASGGKSAAGGSSATGGANTAGAGPITIDCNAAMPTGGTPHQSSNASGTAAGLTWTIWTNSGPGTITTYSVPAFSASWGGSGDFLARIGLQWNNTKTYDQYGQIAAQMAFKKTGTGGGYSYIGIYGWSTNPCIEYYIVDDSFNGMPVNPGNTTNKGTADIDGGTYIMYSRPTSGTGGSKCSGVSSWTQYYSVRKTARQCGVISITQHFDAWAKAGMALGKLDQAQILVETGGGTGSVDFSTANVTTTQ